MERVTDLTAAHADPNVPRSHRFDGMRLVEDHEVVLEEHPAFGIGLDSIEQGEEQGVVEHQDIGPENLLARALKETNRPQLGLLTLKTAFLGSTQSALGANVLPDLGIGFHREVAQRTILGGSTPLFDPSQLGRFRRGEERITLLHGLAQATGAQVIGAPLQHRKTEVHREHLLQDRQILLHQLLLQIDGVGGNHRLLLAPDGEKNGRNQIRKTFTDTSTSLHEEIPPVLKCRSHSHCHLLLLGAVLEVAGPGKQSALGKDLPDRLHPIGGLLSRGGIGQRNHSRKLRPVLCLRKKALRGDVNRPPLRHPLLS